MRGYKLVMEHASEWYIKHSFLFHLIADIFLKLRRAYAALYCGPMSSKRMFQQYLRKMNFQQNANAGQNSDHLKWLCLHVLAVACPRINR